MKILEDFFVEIDGQWKLSEPGKPRLLVIGSAALILQTDYQRGTKDADILETLNVTATVRGELLRIGGRGTKVSNRYGMYLEVVPNGLPFLPQVPLCKTLTSLNERLRHFEVDVLDVVDVVVSKLKRFNSADEGDITEMIDKGLVAHDELIARFRAAVDVFSCSAEGEDIPRYVKNLHGVERDLFGTSATQIELPAWIADD